MRIPFQDGLYAYPRLSNAAISTGSYVFLLEINCMILFKYIYLLIKINVAINSPFPGSCMIDIFLCCPILILSEYTFIKCITQT